MRKDKLLWICIALFVILIVISSSVGFAFGDKKTVVVRQVNSIERGQFTSTSIIMTEGETVVFKDENGEIYNPFGLEYTFKLGLEGSFPQWKKSDITSFEVVKTGKNSTLVLHIDDTKNYLGATVVDLTLEYKMEKGKVKQLTACYEDKGFKVQISLS